MDGIKDAWGRTPSWVRFLLALLAVEVFSWCVSQLLTSATSDGSIIRLPAVFISNPYVIAVTFGLLLAYPFQLLWKRFFAKRPKLHLSLFCEMKRDKKIGNIQGFDFIVRVQAFSRLTHGKIYCHVSRMASDWSGEQVVWQGGAPSFGVQIGEFETLRTGEHLDFRIAERGPEQADTLRILGAEHDRDKRTYPIERVVIGVVTDEVREERGFGLIAPGYSYNTVVPLELVPMSSEVFSKILEA